MDYSFVRKLVKGVSSSDIKRIYFALLENGIESFVQSEEGYKNATENMLEEKEELYVSAADLSFARESVKGLGLQQYLCSEAEVNMNASKSEVEKAEEEFYRKHRQNQMFAWVIIAGVVIFMIFQLIK